MTVRDGTNPPENHLFLAAIPVLAGIVAFFLLRREDTLLVAGGLGVTGPASNS